MRSSRCHQGGSRKTPSCIVTGRTLETEGCLAAGLHLVLPCIRKRSVACVRESRLDEAFRDKGAACCPTCADAIQRSAGTRCGAPRSCLFDYDPVLLGRLSTGSGMAVCYGPNYRCIREQLSCGRCFYKRARRYSWCISSELCGGLYSFFSAVGFRLPDAFIAKLDSKGALLFLTYLGGTGGNIPDSLAVDAAGNIYVGGKTDSSDFPRAGTPWRPAPVQRRSLHRQAIGRRDD